MRVGRLNFRFVELPLYQWALPDGKLIVLLTMKRLLWIVKYCVGCGLHEEIINI